MRKKELKTVITFETTTQAIGMESACKEYQIEGRLIPVPKDEIIPQWVFQVEI